MEIAFAVLADSANVSVEGKLNVLGTFDTIPATEFPFFAPTVVFAFRVRVEYEDQQRVYRLKVELVDVDGQHLWSAGADMEVGPIEPGQFSHTNQIIIFPRLRFETPGRYRFRVRFDDENPHDTVFQVVPVEASR